MKRVFLFLFIMLSCSLFAQVPDWYTTGELPHYSRDDYFIGLGEGASFEDAQSDAQAAIAAQLRVTIESTVEVFTRESRAGDDIDFTEDVTQSTTATVEETVQGVEIIEQEQAGNRYYVFAVLHKMTFFNGLKMELQDLGLQIEKGLERAREDIRDGQVFTSLENYADVYSNTLLYYTKKGFLDSLAGPAFSQEATVSPAEVIGEIRRVLSALEVDILSGNNQRAELGEYLPEPIEVIAYYNDPDGSRIPVSNMRFIIRGPDNAILDRVTANSRGVAEVHITATPDRGNRGRIKAELDMRNLSSTLRGFMRRAEVTARYEVEQSGSVAVRLSIETEDGRPLPRLEQSISRLLTDLGFRVSNDGPLLIEGVVRKADEQEIDGYFGTQYLVNVELVMELFIADTGEVISTAYFDGAGMSTDSSDAALQAAYDRVTLGRRELTDFMSGAKAELQR